MEYRCKYKKISNLKLFFINCRKWSQSEKVCEHYLVNFVGRRQISKVHRITQNKYKKTKDFILITTNATMLHFIIINSCCNELSLINHY